MQLQAVEASDDPRLHVKLPRTNLDEEGLASLARVSMRKGGRTSQTGQFLWDLAFLIEGHKWTTVREPEWHHGSRWAQAGKQLAQLTRHDVHMSRDDLGFTPHGRNSWGNAQLAWIAGRFPCLHLL